MGWQLFVDRGGTFTDVVARGPGGRKIVTKLLSLAGGEEDALARALAAVPGPIDELRLGTTVATNALLERRGERVRLVTTRGFADLLEIGTQDRPEIFALSIDKRARLHAEVVEVDERVLADGTCERAADRAELAAAMAGAGCVAVVFLNADANPVNERLAGEVAAGLGIAHVALSHAVAPGIGAVARGDTTVADAYLTPALQRFVRGVLAPGRRVLCMQSSGGLADAAAFSGRDAVLSGPAGGVVAAARVGADAGFPQVIGLDMGGTSTDVCRCAGEPDRAYETVVAGVRLRAPMLEVATVAAGGGSILAERDGRRTVGPASAGADPGPACYGRGGPATLTDANLVLGRIQPRWFPHLELDVEAARAALAAFGDPVAAARGFVAVADESMAAAIRLTSTARGFDARDHALCCFGGAAGQHACALAERLGMDTILVHPLAGVLSAWGLGLADVTADAVAPVLDGGAGPPPFPVEAARAGLRDGGDATAGAPAARDHVGGAAPSVDATAADVVIERSVDARYAGTDDVLVIPWEGDGRGWQAAFEEHHRELFGFTKPGRAIELVAARARAIRRTALPDEPAAEERAHDADPVERRVGPLGADVFERAALRPGARLSGPAIVVEDHATTVVDPGWTARVDGRGVLVLRRDDRRERRGPAGATGPGRDSGPPVPARRGPTITAERDPVSLEIMGNRFMSLAWQMGEALRRVAHSTNIKERLDFSCALFDGRGDLVANAPHIPVHLGAMGETVRHLLGAVEMRPGDAWLTNDPFAGGSHLPDLTVVSPVFRDGRLAFLVANRGHHADVGGPTPGSMPPDSTTLDEEGVVLRDVLAARDGALREADLRALLVAGGVRGVDERLADLAGQVACNASGARRFSALCDELGAGTVAAWMGHVRDNAAEVMADVIAGLRGGSFEDRLDDGSVIKVAITVDGGRARVDFTGTSPQQRSNRNAPRAVTIAAVLYVFRTLARRPIPLNAGCLDPLDIVVPPGSLLDPRPPAAVVGGNVETSQRVVDVLYGALGVLAAAQGTMNNLTFGDGAFGYYETICGGAGAGCGFDGASAVHTHMTNTRITDPEVLEQRHPVVLREFSIRRGSGGRGVWRGGDGVVRRIEFLRPLQCSILAERRTTAPFGIRAEPGARGEHEITARGVVVRTPGGGGYSPTPEQWAALPEAERRRLVAEGRADEDGRARP